jgi:hypothetical protein
VSDQLPARTPREEAVLRRQLEELRLRGGAVLVGQQPNAACERHPSGWLLPEEDSGTFHTANRLRAYAGFTQEEYLRVFPVRTNACAGAGEFSLEEARRRVADLFFRLRPLARQPRVVFLGRKSWAAARALVGRGELGLDFPPYRWHDIGQFLRREVCYVPHTSGLTRAYNTPEQRAACREFLQALRKEIERP